MSPKLKLGLMFILGVVAGASVATAIPSYMQALDRSHTRRAAADIRAVSSALEHYRNARGSYPPLESDVEALLPYLKPEFIESLPSRDIYNQPYLVLKRGDRALVVFLGRNGAAAAGGELVAGFPSKQMKQ